MKEIIEVEYPDYSLENKLMAFVDKLKDENGEMKEGVYNSHIIIEHVPNQQ